MVDGEDRIRSWEDLKKKRKDIIILMDVTTY